MPPLALVAGIRVAAVAAVAAVAEVSAGRPTAARLRAGTAGSTLRRDVAVTGTVR